METQNRGKRRGWTKTWGPVGSEGIIKREVRPTVMIETHGGATFGGVFGEKRWLNRWCEEENLIFLFLGGKTGDEVAPRGGSLLGYCGVDSCCMALLI